MTISPLNRDTVPETNTSTINFSVIGTDPSISKNSITKEIQPGDIVEYQIVINNPVS